MRKAAGIGEDGIEMTHPGGPLISVTPQIESYLRQQLSLERDPWWIASELARMARIGQAEARMIVDQFSAEVRNRAAWKYIPMLLVGLAALSMGATVVLMGQVIMGGILMSLGVAPTTVSWFAWRRLRG